MASGCRPLGVALVPLLLSGTAWIATLMVLNASAQLSLAHWVRARGLAAYLLIFMGSQALGAALWGLIAAHYGVTIALTAAALLLGVTAASVTLLPLRAATGTLARTPSACWPTPTIVFEPDLADGPVLVRISYRVTPEHTSQFVSAMKLVAQSRNRTGGYGWRLYRDGEDPQRIVEQFMVRSWEEFTRQRATRWLASDHDALAQALAHTTDGAAQQHWYLAVPTNPK
ncbi:MAG: MFS transporter [Mycolicibacterium sp.]|nr:MFS transporter [Mycolicibacterium sp.]